MKKAKVEFIESYYKIDGGDYKWDDNHGQLVRCKDCRFWKPKVLVEDSERSLCARLTKKNTGFLYDVYINVEEDDYCSFAEKSERIGSQKTKRERKRNGHT